MKITVGQFLSMRSSNPDTYADPYYPEKENFIELNLKEVGFKPLGSLQLPPPPDVVLSTRTQVPEPPSVTLSSQMKLPPPPAVELSQRAVLPPPPEVDIYNDETLPPPPKVGLSQPEALPPPPSVVKTDAAVLPPPPDVTLSKASDLPEPPKFGASSHDPDKNAVKVPSEYQVNPRRHDPAKNETNVPVDQVVNPNYVPPPDQDLVNRMKKNEFKIPPKTHLSAKAVENVDSGYLTAGDDFTEKYSPMGAGIGAGSMGMDPILYERSVERLARTPEMAARVGIFTAQQLALFAGNIASPKNIAEAKTKREAGVWNPLLINAAPVLRDFMEPTIGGEPLTRERAERLDRVNNRLADKAAQISLPYSEFDVYVNEERTERTNANSQDLTVLDEVLASADMQIFYDISDNITDFGIRAKTEFNGLGGKSERSMRYVKSEENNGDSDYFPLSFTDMRRGSDGFRSVFFQPINLKITEDLSPTWNKTQFFGRVDQVATYQGTARTFSLSFRAQAFSPSDMPVIYEKLHWLASMVYPQYDANMSYRAGPAVRLRIGDIINAKGAGSNEFLRGVPGIIESITFDYNESIWETERTNKIPLGIDVSVSFTALHDKPIGMMQGIQNAFGGVASSVNTEKIAYAGIMDTQMKQVHENSFRKIANLFNTYTKEGDVSLREDQEAIKENEAARQEAAKAQAEADRLAASKAAADRRARIAAEARAKSLREFKNTARSLRGPKPKAIAGEGMMGLDNVRVGSGTGNSGNGSSTGKTQGIGGINNPDGLWK